MPIAVLSVVLLSLSALFLYIEKLTHQEFMLHVAAIPLEILVGVILVERFLSYREKKLKRDQLSYIKGYLFRFDMRRIFLLNFSAVAAPPISVAQIRRASPEEIRNIRDDVSNSREITFKSYEALDPVLHEYIKSEDVFKYFLEWAIRHQFEDVFRNMIFVLNFIQHLKVLKDVVPNIRFAEEACGESDLFAKIQMILKDNIISFLDYAIELKERRPEEFEELMKEYELTSRYSPIAEERQRQAAAG